MNGLKKKGHFKLAKWRFRKGLAKNSQFVAVHSFMTHFFFFEVEVELYYIYITTIYQSETLHGLH